MYPANINVNSEPFLCAMQALGETNFEHFFTHLKSINNSTEISRLLEQAIPVAIKLENIEVLSILAKWASEDSDSYNALLVTRIVESLVEFKKPDSYLAAIAVTILYAKNHKNYRSLWFTLCEAFLNKQQNDYVVNLFLNLEEKHEKSEIVIKALDQVDISENHFVWFTWFSRYLLLEERYLYKLDNYFNQAISSILQYSHFERVLPLFLIKEESQNHNSFLKKLFYKLIISKETTKIERLLPKLPASLVILQKIYAALTDETMLTDKEVLSEFSFDSFSDRETKEALLVVVLENMFEKYKNDTLEEIKTRVEKLNFSSNAILVLFCIVCCRKQRPDIALHFIKTLTFTNFQFLKVCFNLIDTHLNVNDYRYILTKLEYWPDDIQILKKLELLDSEHQTYHIQCTYELRETLKLLRKIPRNLVNVEESRRQTLKKKRQEVEEAGFFQRQNESIVENHVDYSTISKIIQRKINTKQLEQALSLTKKLAGSAYRDELAVVIAMNFWELGNVQKTQEACLLLKHKGEIWRQWPNRFSSNNYKKTLNWLCSNNFQEVRILIDLYVEKIFSSNSPHVALTFILSSDLMLENKIDFQTYYRSNDTLSYFAEKPEDFSVEYEPLVEDEKTYETITVTSGTEEEENTKQNLEERIISQFIAYYADSKNLLKKMTELKASGVKGLEGAVIYYHLRRHQLDKAINLMNLFPIEEDNLSSLTRVNYVQEMVVDYFKNKAPRNSNTLHKVRKIQQQYLRALVLRDIVEGWKLKINKEIDETTLLRLIIQAVNEIGDINLQQKVLAHCFNFFDESPGEQHLRLIENITNEKIKERWLQDITLFAIPNNSELAYKITTKHFKGKSFWHGLTINLQHASKGYVSYRDNLVSILDNSIEWIPHLDPYGPSRSTFTQFMQWVVKQSIMNDTSPIEAYKLIQEKLTTLTFTDWKLKAHYQTLHELALVELIERAKKDKKLMRELLAQLDMGLNNKISNEYLLKYRTTATELLNYLIQENDNELIKEAFQLIYRHISVHDDAPLYKLKDTLKMLIKNKQIRLVCDLLLSVLATHYQDFFSGYMSCFKSACKYWIENESAQPLIVFLKEVENSLNQKDIKNIEYIKIDFLRSKIELLVEFNIQLVKTKQYSAAQKFYQEHLQYVNSHFLHPLLDELVKSNQLIFANAILTSTIHIPQMIITYRNKLIAQHFIRLANDIPPEYASKIQQAYEHLISYFQQRRQATPANINYTQSQLIKFAREILDKAFLHFYRLHFTQPLVKKPKPPCIYFPVVPDLNGKSLNDQLTHYFNNNLKCPQFITQFPDLYQYLLTIQPLGDPSYIWLAQLYKMANIDKHDHDLPVQPVINGVTINMPDYLPNLISGIEKILVKLFNHNLTNQELDERVLAAILPININNIPSAAAYFQTNRSAPEPGTFSPAPT